MNSLTEIQSQFNKVQRDLTLKRGELNDLMRTRKKTEIDMSDAKESFTTISDGIVIVQQFSGQIQTGIIDKFEDLLNRGIRQIFGRDYTIDIEFQAKANSFWADFYVTLPNGKRINMQTEGGGLKEVAAILMRILYIMLEPTQPAKFMILDESLASIDEWRAPDAIKFITFILTELGIQTIWITHNQSISSGDVVIPGMSVLQVSLNGDESVITKTGGDKNDDSDRIETEKGNED